MADQVTARQNSIDIFARLGQAQSMTSLPGLVAPEFAPGHWQMRADVVRSDFRLDLAVGDAEVLRLQVGRRAEGSVHREGCGLVLMADQPGTVELSEA